MEFSGGTGYWYRGISSFFRSTCRPVLTKDQQTKGRRATNDFAVTLRLAMCLLGFGLTSALFGQTESNCLVLWNKLGSDREVLNSEIGLGLEFYDKDIHGGGSFDVEANRAYVSGVGSKYSSAAPVAIFYLPKLDPVACVR